MDLKTSKYLQPPPTFSYSHSHGVVGVRKGNPFVDSGSGSSSSSLDLDCKLNLKETSEFVRSFPESNKKVGGANKRNGLVEAPSTPGRPIFSFSVANTNNNAPKRNFVPSKWNDAEKWLISDHDSTTQNHHHLHGFVKSADFVSRNSSSNNSNSNGFGIKHHNHTKVISQDKVLVFKNYHHSNSTASDSFDVLKDKFTKEVQEPKRNLKETEYLEPLRESFVFKENSSRDIGTEMTPLGSSTTSRCQTPFKTMSPPRHNTPASRSGPLDPNTSLDMGELQYYHLAKLKLDTHTPFDSSNWSSREEEEEDISKSLRHFEMTKECRKSISETRACAWDEQDKTKCCLRYQREEAKIQAWVDLQNAKAEAQSRKLEVKIQKMRSKFEEKVMRKMAIVHRKAEELRAAVQLEHTEQIQKVTDQSNKTIHQHLNMHFSGSCGCFPYCNNLHT